MEAVSEKYSRTKDEILDAMHLAHLDESDFTETTQVLRYAGPNNDKQTIKLFELDAQLAEVVNLGDGLSFRGDKKETAILCTKDHTYELKKAETSNHLLLVPDLKFLEATNVSRDDAGRILEEKDVRGIFTTYYEVYECRPKLKKLLVVLEPSSFKGNEHEKSLDPGTLYNWDRLQSEIQASESQMKQALPDYLIANMDGYFRLISFEFEARGLSLMLDVIEDYAWELDSINKELTYESTKDSIPRPIFEVLFQMYTELSGTKSENGTPLYRYNEGKTCKLLAKVLLAACPVTAYKQFMEAWRMGTPEKMEPKEEYLSGIALVTWNSSRMRKEVVSFPEANLPENITERFDELFKVKDKWTIEDITPYVINLTTTKMNVNALLTKYARHSTVNGVKYYSAKHGK